MGMLDRYRKSGGFVQLLNLIETSPPAKQEKFLGLIAEESPIWSVEVRKKMLTLDRVLSWNVEYLMEFVPNIPDKIIAAAIIEAKPEDRDKVLKAVSSSLRKRIEEHLAGPPPTPAEIATCQMKVIQEARNASTSGSLKLEKIDPDLSIPEDVEDKLKERFSLSPRGGSSPASAASVSSAPATAGKGSSSTDDLELRRRLGQLENENQVLQRENLVLKEKLNQIKKIA
jgi:FliG C-terminal domain